MGWSIGYDEKWKRDIGYGVPAFCDHPGCGAEIDRGLSFVCRDEQPYGGEDGCGLYFCEKHHGADACTHAGFTPSPDHPDWLRHKLTHESWQQWRDENPSDVQTLQFALDVERATVAAQQLAETFRAAEAVARAYAEDFRTAVQADAAWCARHLIETALRAVALERYKHLRRQHIAKARGRNWRAVRLTGGSIR